MGCCSSSKVFVVNDKYPGQGEESLKLFQKLLFTNDDINLMYNAFCEFDLTGDGNISLLEFLTILQIEETPITKEIFDELDGDDKKMDFAEFVLHIWYYCVQDKKKICDMAFDIFDINDNGLLSEDEIKQMVSEIYGTRGLHHDLQKIIQKLDRNKDGQISRQEFQSATTLFPALLFPAYEIQTIFQQRIGGEEFWRDKALQAQNLLRNPEIAALFTKKKTVQKKERRKTQAAEYKKKQEKAKKRSAENTSPYGSNDDCEIENLEDGNENGEYDENQDNPGSIDYISPRNDGIPRDTSNDESQSSTTSSAHGGGGGKKGGQRRSTTNKGNGGGGNDNGGNGGKRRASTNRGPTKKPH